VPLTPVAEIKAQPAPAELLDTDPSLWAIVFAGGIGSRFWPLSTPQRPKATLHLLGERSLIADTIHRLAPMIPPERVLVLTSHDIAEVIRAAVPEVPSRNVLVEPRPLGTAAALAWGLDTVRRWGSPASIVCATHSDLAAAFPDQFREALRRAITTAMRERALVALAVPPTRAETSFGYIVPGDPLEAGVPVNVGGTCEAARFVEKPSLDSVVGLLSVGALWHSGVFVGAAGDMLDALLAHAAELAPARDALAAGNMPLFAERAGSISVERGLLERTTNLMAVPMECGWDDVGTWASLKRARDLDDDGNGAIGQAHFIDSTSNVVHTEAGTVVLFGCDRMLVVSLDGLTFVTPLDKAAELRPLLDQLPGRLRTDPTG
jgi:mannose-1-phosphate guanylyltransferase